MVDRTYQAVIEYFNDNFAYWATHILNLGKPEYTTSVPTAAVAVTSDDGDRFTNFSFLFNPDFLDSFPTVDQKAFIFAHESMHILLDHLTMAKWYCNWDMIERLADKHEKGQATDDELVRLLVEQKKMQCFNIAADCVINDYLVQEGFDLPSLDKGAPIDLCIGMREVGHDCSNYTVREVYNELMQKFQGKDEATSEGSGVDNHDWMFKQAKEAIEAAKKLRKELEGQGDIPASMEDMEGGKRYSLTAEDVQNDFTDKTGVSMEWMKLLQHINPDVFKQIGIGPPEKPSFHRKRRKMGAYQDIHLPVKRRDPRTEGETDKIPALVIALDTSGSISQQDRDKFVTLARSVPQKKIKLFPITFTTNWKELDLDSPNYNSGGTCFSCIQDYIIQKVVPVLGHYPKSVVVVTDGEADFSNGLMPSTQEFKSWYWLLTDYPQTRDINRWTPGRDKKVRDFVKGR